MTKKKKKKKNSQYGIRLETKQKLRFHYGINEKQLVRYVKKARSLKGSTGKLLLKLLEMRLDNIIFRTGLVPTIPASRQIINHGHILVNDIKMDIPSYQCKPKDKIVMKRSSKDSLWIKSEDKKSKKDPIPSHLNWDTKEKIITIISDLQYEEVGLNLNELLVIEYYSRS